MDPAVNLIEQLLPEGIFWADERTLESVTPGSHIKARWRCAQGHSWTAQVYSVVLEGCGCPYCAGKLAIPGETDLVTLEPELAEQFDREKNGSLDPGDLLPSSHIKVWWRCEQGHSWEAPPYSRLKGSRCPYCTGKKVLSGFNDLATLKPKVAEEWHPTLNSGLTPQEVSPGSNKKVWWRCSEHHVWQAVVYSRTRKNGSGCPVCAGTVKQIPKYIQKQPSRRTQPAPVQTAASTGAD